MDGMTRADLQGVVAPLNFMVPMVEKRRDLEGVNQ